MIAKKERKETNRNFNEELDEGRVWEGEERMVVSLTRSGLVQSQYTGDENTTDDRIFSLTDHTR